MMCAVVVHVQKGGWKQPGRVSAWLWLSKDPNRKE
jgi:hypothetical protein